MASIVKVFWKKPVERRRLYLDYSCWLAADEVLNDFQVTVQPYTDAAPIVVTSGYPDAEHKRLMIFIAGGVATTNYTLAMVVRTDQGQTKQDNIGIRVAY